MFRSIRRQLWSYSHHHNVHDYHLFMLYCTICTLNFPVAHPSRFPSLVVVLDRFFANSISTIKHNIAFLIKKSTFPINVSFFINESTELLIHNLFSFSVFFIATRKYGLKSGRCSIVLSLFGFKFDVGF